MSSIRKSLNKGRFAVALSLALASCDLGGPLPAHAQLVSGSATSLSGGAAYPSSACQGWQVLAYSGGWTCAQQSGLEFLAGKASAVNLNLVGDTAITLTGPSTGQWAVVRAVIANCSVANSSVQAAFYTGAGATGANFLGAGAASYGGAAGATTSTFSRVVGPYISPNSGNWQLAFAGVSTGVVYFRVTTAAGAAQTCDVSIYGQTL